MKEEMTDSNQNKLAVVFPGIGYHVDKPLLFHTRKLLRELGYEVADVNYTGFPSGIKGNPQKMKEAFDYIVPRSGIVFHGTSDPWADTEIITGKCSEYEIDLFITNDANHSLEIGDTLKDIQELYTIMDTVKWFISSEG